MYVCLRMNVCLFVFEDVCVCADECLCVMCVCEDACMRVFV